MTMKGLNENLGTSVKSTHKCGWSCLGPLTFHSQVVGSKVSLSDGCCLAKRTENTFKNGLVFSSRTVKPMEKIRLRVEKDMCGWHGALRVGFTNVPPSSRSLPLPILAVPNLTDTPGHWAAPVHESLCREGSELEFWVSMKGSIYVSGGGLFKHKLVRGVDLSQPLWAMIDIYGNTCAILLLGSTKETWPKMKTSCPLPSAVLKKKFTSDLDIMSDSEEDESVLLTGNIKDVCVVCLTNGTRVTLPCGHRCLCMSCSSRVIQEFGHCPLCRFFI